MNMEQAVALTIAVLGRPEDLFGIYDAALGAKPEDVAERIRSFVKKLVTDDESPA